jgi:hypothetical protein
MTAPAGLRKKRHKHAQHQVQQRHPNKAGPIRDVAAPRTAQAPVIYLPSLSCVEIRTTHKPSESPMGHVPMHTTETWRCVYMTRRAGSPPPSSSQHRDRTRTLGPYTVTDEDPHSFWSLFKFTGETTGTGPVPPGPDRPFSDPPKNPIVGWSQLLDPPKNPGLGWSHLWDPPQNPIVGWSHLWSSGAPGPGTGTGPVTGFWVF